MTKLSTNNSNLWKASKQALHFNVTTPPIKKSDGGYALSDTEKAELFKNHLFNVFLPHQDIPPVNSSIVLSYFDIPLPPSVPVKNFSPSVFKFAIQKCTLKKSPGFDLITAEVAKCLPKLQSFYLLIYLMPYSDCRTFHSCGSSPKSSFSQNQTSLKTW